MNICKRVCCLWLSNTSLLNRAARFQITPAHAIQGQSLGPFDFLSESDNDDDDEENDINDDDNNDAPGPSHPGSITYGPIDFPSDRQSVSCWLNLQVLAPILIMAGRIKSPESINLSRLLYFLHPWPQVAGGELVNRNCGEVWNHQKLP